MNLFLDMFLRNLDKAPNIFVIGWLLLSIVVTVLGTMTLYFPRITPIFVKKLFKYGKADDESKYNRFLQFLQVPKRWFTHFYVFASLFFTFLAYSLWSVYFEKQPVNRYLLSLLKCFSLGEKNASVRPESVTLAMFLLLAQAYRRCYECLGVSIYSNSTINVFHYLVGYIFYFGAGLSLFAEATGFSSEKAFMEVNISGEWITTPHILGTLISIWAFYIQYTSNLNFANLRTNKRGKVVTLKHSIPRGGLFEVVSCPHYFAEIVLYLSIALIFSGEHKTWWLVTLWVVANQIMTGLMNHFWYLKTYKNYPKKRKAVIPYLL